MEQTTVLPKRSILPFSTDAKLRDSYINPLGEIRLGLILEELDAMAGKISYRHATSPEAVSIVDNLLSAKGRLDPSDLVKANIQIPIYIVTASCNRIEFYEKIDVKNDLIFEGFVSWVGRSSMEVRITLHSVEDGKRTQKLVSLFTMVARNPKNGQAANVTPIHAETAEEKFFFGHATERKKAMLNSVTIAPPTEDERKLIHDLFLETKKHSNPSQPPVVSFMNATNLPENYFYMDSTKYQSTIIMQPQKRNIHNKIFGGYLMRKAYELAFTVAYCFSRSIVNCTAIDDISFLAPVEIGNILTFTGQVVYSEGSAVQVAVAADVINGDYRNPGQKVSTTNVFHFTFVTPEDLKSKVVPFSYEESLRFIDGRRKMLKTPINKLKL